MELNAFYNNHKYECSKLHDVYINCIPDNGICFDIGSNMGMYSESLLEKKNVFIHLFEPIKEYFNISVDKLRKYKDSVAINNFGLSNISEQKTIYMDCKNETNNPGWNTYIDVGCISRMIPETTTIITLDDYCTEHNISKIDFIKIDTEGYEAFVIDGFLKTLKNLTHKPYLYVEVAWGINHPNWEFSKSVFEKLRTLGYDFPDLNNLTTTTDVLFTPIDRKK